MHRLSQRVLSTLALTVLILLAIPLSVQAAFEQSVSNSCIECHRGLEDSGLSQPVELWSKSVHAQVGNTCDGCHGGDPNDASKKSMSAENHFYASPKEDEIVDFCGKCHQELANNFKMSAHAETGEQACIGCHGSHTIRRISLDIINEELCSTCHDYEPAQKLKGMLLELHEGFRLAESKLQLIKGFPTGPAHEDLKKLWKELRQVRMLAHTFDIPRIATEAVKVKASIAEIDGKIEKLSTLSKERSRWGYITILIFMGLIVLTFFYNKQNQDLD